MTVPSETNQSAYVGNGATTVFSTGFYFIDDDEVVVRITPLAGVEVVKTKGVHYTVTMPAGIGLNGSITMLAAPAVGDAVVVERTLALTQEMSLRNQGSFSPAIHEDAFDRAVFRDQQLGRRISALESAGAAGSVIAGNGLSFIATTLHVGAGAGIQSNADTVEVLFGSAAGVVYNGGTYNGVADQAARADHGHTVTVGAVNDLHVGDVADPGAGTGIAIGGHVHGVPVGAPVAVDAAAAVTGASGNFSDASHKHQVSTGVPVTITDATNGAGAATSLAKSDHTHAHGNRGGGALHADATAVAAGFMPASIFDALNGIKASKTHVRAYQTALQSIPNFTATTIIFDTEEYDAAGEYNNATGIFTAAQDGYYIVTASVGLAAAAWAAGNSMGFSLVKNATSECGGGEVFDAAINRASVGRAATGIFLAAGNTLKVVMLQNQGGAVNTTASRTTTVLTIDRLL